ncbi:hypothetical protein HanRHA438_Chr16g0758631 [Helianthus annuus]|uniref:Uncharacterized protein n=1 Tax=Helianthus annuus TaxID=4232 RepID=A0A251U7F0_HELAN|nr:hypothetical protein HanXRQr2_Chr16g0746991 [Helianthus annuus]KAJ0438021.1 hypothetical protein HanHA300_Chr16g0609161 [Helianthus annuus]KAJ0460347.1 hypothetical protein HanHA89_Chr16g0659771 [Helianthus annuus]KAJ0640790.1 hypothetical protein HanLR1_Chr16g0619761 [Helianthus annuus]KAJ0644699.1 hypothetical protein HanOQP8_Chr16g0615321 [Helianthus annuus]
MAVEEDPTVAMGVSRKVMTMSVLELRLFPVTEGYIISQLGFLNKNNTLLLHDSGPVTHTHFRCTEHW